MIARLDQGGAWAIVPVKQFDRAKSRLAGVLTPVERASLAKAMLGDVLNQLQRARGFRGVVVVTGDVRARAMAAELGFDCAPDPCESGVDKAVLRGIGHARDHDASAVVVVPGDIPFAGSREFEAALGALASASVALAPAARDGGTNLLALAPIDAIAPSFGENSFERHLAAAKAASAEAIVLDLVGASRDIDVAADLVGLAALPGGARTHACLRRLGVGGRLAGKRHKEGVTP